MCIRDTSQASHQRVHCGGVLNHLEASSRQAITNLVPLPCAASWAMDACRPHFAISTSLARHRTCVLHLCLSAVAFQISRGSGIALRIGLNLACLLYTSDAADDLTRVDLGGRRI